MTKRKFYSDIQDTPQKGSGQAFALLDANGNVVRGSADNSYVPKVGSGTKPYTIDNGTDGLSISNGVVHMDFGIADIGANKFVTEEFTSQTIFTNELRFGTKDYQDGSTLSPEQGVLSIIGDDGLADVTITLPPPAPGRCLVLSGVRNYTDPYVERVTPAFASHIQYINSSNVEVTIASGEYFSVKGRCIMLMGVSAIRWRLVGGYL